MNKKALVFVTMLAFSLLLTPIAFATPGAQKSNAKFEFFELVVTGAGSGVNDREWYTPPNADPLENKTTHVRGGEWTTGPLVELTVGEDTYTMNTSPNNITWTTTFDMDLIRNNTGAIKRVNIRLIDVVTVYNTANETIGTLVLILKSAIVPGGTPVYYGNIVGYGTGDLKGVHISAVDYGFVGAPPPTYVRNGTITGWPLPPPT